MPDSEMLPDYICDHMFTTTISPDKFEAVVVRSCRAPFTVEVVGSDPTIIPQPRVFAVSFASFDDRDRVRIAMRFVEKEQAEIVAKAARAPVRPIAPKMAVGAA